MASKTAEELLTEMYYATDGRRERIREQAIEKHMGLVRYVAQKYRKRAKKEGYEFGDIEGAGFIGLIKAVERYDPNRGPKFATYATPTIDGEIKRYFRDHPRMQIPRCHQERMSEYERTIDILAQTDGKTPPHKEVCREMGMPEEEAEERWIAMNSQFPASLDDPAHEEDGIAGCLSDDIGDGRSLTMGKLQEDGCPYPIMEAVERLKEPFKKTILLHYFENHSQTEVAREMGCSQMHVSRRLRQARQALREYIMREERKVHASM